MIVLDEQLGEEAIRVAFSAWYRGRVTTIQELGRAGLSDSSLVRILRQHRGCTFVTINHTDFWNVEDGDPRCAILCLSVPTHRRLVASTWVRRVFQLAPFQTQRARSGLVMYVRENVGGIPEVLYYRRRSGSLFGPVALG